LTAVSTAPRILTARWVLPMCGEPLENGGIEIAGDKVVAVYAAQPLAERLQRNADCDFVSEIKAKVADFGQSIIMPGLINLHTHVEWTAQELFDTQSALLDWIPGLINSAKPWSLEQYFASAAAGVRRIARSGTTTILDSSYTGQAAPALASRGLRGVVALELFGIDDSRTEENWQNWLVKRDRLLASGDFGDLIKVTVAPHALYTVCFSLLRKAIAWAEKEKLPVTIHLAESRNEFDWIKTTDMKMDKFLSAVHTLPGGKVENIPCRACGKTPIQAIDDEKLLVPSMVAAHAVQLTAADIQTLARRKTKIAHCPRSNARLRAGVAPLRALIESGVQVGIGTDSAASTDNLDLLSETRFAWNLQRACDPEFALSSEQAIAALTVNAAAALGMSDSIGSLAPGKQADIAIFNIVSDGVWAERAPYDALLYGKTELGELLVAGRKVDLERLY
jgi:cytosine/adenosine deaminase-related metal-dependent hydrolase